MHISAAASGQSERSFEATAYLGISPAARQPTYMCMWWTNGRSESSRATNLFAKFHGQCRGSNVLKMYAYPSTL
jgi:hypothetical protein